MKTETNHAIAPILFLGLLLLLATGSASAQWNQLGYDIGSFSDGDQAGRSVSLSADGLQVAIGVPLWNAETGVVHVYKFTDGHWRLKGQWIALDGANNDHNGYSVSMSADGLRVAVGAPGSDVGGADAGMVRVYEWQDPAWVQVGPDLVGDSAGEAFGFSVALSANGLRVAAGSPSTGGGGSAGRVRVFRWIHPNWYQVGIDLEGEFADDESGYAVSLSADGSRVAIGAPFNSNQSGIQAGHVRVYEWFNLTSTWLFVGDDIDGEAPGDYFGTSVALSGDGSRLAVGATGNDGAGSLSGHVRVFEYASPDWVQLEPDIDGEAAGDLSGTSVSISADGSRVAIGSPKAGGSFPETGHVRIFQWQDPGWDQVGSDLEGHSYDELGYSVSLSADGFFVAVGAPFGWGWDDYCGYVNVYVDQLFADDFESGSTAAWSSTVP